MKANVSGWGFGVARYLTARHNELLCLTTFHDLRKNYIDTGKIRFVTVDLPLDMHSNAHKAAVAARCAGETARENNCDGVTGKGIACANNGRLQSSV